MSKMRTERARLLEDGERGLFTLLEDSSDEEFSLQPGGGKLEVKTGGWHWTGSTLICNDSIFTCTGIMIMIPSLALLAIEQFSPSKCTVKYTL